MPLGQSLPVTHASQVVLQRPIHASRPTSGAGLTALGQGDQRIYRALHTLEPYPIAALINCLHRPRRTHPASSKRVLFDFGDAALGWIFLELQGVVARDDSVRIATG